VAASAVRAIVGLLLSKVSAFATDRPRHIFALNAERASFGQARSAIVARTLHLNVQLVMLKQPNARLARLLTFYKPTFPARVPAGYTTQD
jgi:hypothetical protein